MATPPKFFVRLLRFFCHPDYLEELEGDLQETYELDLEEKGSSFANRRYRSEIVKLMRPSVLKGVSWPLFRSSFKIAYRNLRQDLVGGLINIIGLALALTSALFIFLFVHHEMSVDDDFAKKDRIYRVTYDERPHRDNGRYLATVAPPFAPTLAAEFNEVEAAVRLRYMDDVILSHEENMNYESDGIYVDPQFFDLFDFPFASGDHESALLEPNSIVLTPAIARKYFGDEDPMGKSLMLDDEIKLKVTGVLTAEPAGTHLDFDFLISFSTFKVPHGYPVTLDSWGWISFHTYVLMRRGFDRDRFHAKLEDFAARHVYADRDVSASFQLQSLDQIYFHSGNMMNTGDLRRGSLVYTSGLTAIAFMILLVAGFNYMNISTARSFKRSREVGVRKVLGAKRGVLISQFVAESLATSLLSLIVALLLFEVLRRYLLQYLGWPFEFDYRYYALLLPTLFIVTVVIGVLSSLYPAGVLANFRPTQALRGLASPGNRQLSVRKILVVLQFGITVLLIFSTIVVTRQMAFVQGTHLGYDRDQLVYLQLSSDDFLDYYEVARNVFSDNPAVLSITAGDVMDGDYGSVPVTPFGSEESIAMNMMGGHFDYFTSLGVEILEGRDFSRSHPTDTLSAVIINESVAKVFDWDDPIGQRLLVNTDIEGEVIGVVKDFHFHSLHNPIGPMVTVIPRTHMDKIIMRIAPVADMQKLISSLEDDWKAIAPHLPFAFSFVDDDLKSQYQSDQLFAKMIRFFSVLAIFIAGLGLYGLVTIISAFRTKEIGIRKVLGASVLGISMLLSRNFIALILVANVVAIPIGWWVMSKWLNNFAYRVDITWNYFAAAVVLSLLVAAVAIGYQVLQSSRVNPVHSLSE